MTRYYFHIRDGDDLQKDVTGIDLPSVENAKEEAVASVRDFLADNMEHGEQLDHRRFDVWDEQGVSHFILPFKGAIGIE